jgi:hypothetical protein
MSKKLFETETPFSKELLKSRDMVIDITNTLKSDEISLYHTQDTSLEELERDMILIKDLQMKILDKDQSVLITLSKLRKSLSNLLTLKRTSKGKTSVTVKEGQVVKVGDVLYVIKDNIPVLKE